MVETTSNQLLESSTRQDLPRVVVWQIPELQSTLAAKHPETFWITAASRFSGDRETFMYEHVLHTRKPMTSALPTLIEAGVITVDHLIKRDINGRVTEKGPLFKIRKKDFNLLFPPAMHYTL